jgi:hypothetical protein
MHTSIVDNLHDTHLRCPDHPRLDEEHPWT